MLKEFKPLKSKDKYMENMIDILQPIEEKLYKAEEQLAKDRITIEKLQEQLRGFRKHEGNESDESN